MKLIPFLKSVQIIGILLILGITGLIRTAPVHAFDEQDEGRVSDAVNRGLHHFLDLADPDTKVVFDPRIVAPVLEFVEAPKANDTIYHSDIVRNLTSAYYDFDIHKKLNSILNYAFNPDIPAAATMPSSTRLLKWIGTAAGQRNFPRVSSYLSRKSVPVEFRGRQFIEITPDLNSGAYYGYETHQFMLIFKHKQRDVFVAVSKQVDVSTVGKKGYVLGSDSDWDYLYTGETGLTVPALGWVKSYMYDSSGINIYYAIEPTVPKVRCGVFKWLRAGWSGINMVQKKHIYRGLKRFGPNAINLTDIPRLFCFSGFPV